MVGGDFVRPVCFAGGIDQQIAWAKENGLLVFLDMHQHAQNSLLVILERDRPGAFHVWRYNKSLFGLLDCFCCFEPCRQAAIPGWWIDG